jgi:hypothetical protein
MVSGMHMPLKKKYLCRSDAKAIGQKNHSDVDEGPAVKCTLRQLHKWSKKKLYWYQQYAW